MKSVPSVVKKSSARIESSPPFQILWWPECLEFGSQIFVTFPEDGRTPGGAAECGPSPAAAVSLRGKDRNPGLAEGIENSKLKIRIANCGQDSSWISDLRISIFNFKFCSFIQIGGKPRVRLRPIMSNSIRGVKLGDGVFHIHRETVERP